MTELQRELQRVLDLDIQNYIEEYVITENKEPRFKSTTEPCMSWHHRYMAIFPDKSEEQMKYAIQFQIRKTRKTVVEQ